MHAGDLQASTKKAKNAVAQEKSEGRQIVGAVLAAPAIPGYQGPMKNIAIPEYLPEDVVAAAIKAAQRGFPLVVAPSHIHIGIHICTDIYIHIHIYSYLSMIIYMYLHTYVSGQETKQNRNR